jgi:hypothetical protein
MLAALVPLLLAPSSAAFADPPMPAPTASSPATTGGGAASAPDLATHEVSASTAPKRNRQFYESGWFWGALGAAAFVGGVIFFATRDNSASAIHLHVEVPH